MKFRIVTGKQPETFDIEMDGPTGFKKTHTNITTELEARVVVEQLQAEYKRMATWQPGIVIDEFDSE